jgi:hypothetical protein
MQIYYRAIGERLFSRSAKEIVSAKCRCLKTPIASVTDQQSLSTQRRRTTNMTVTDSHHNIWPPDSSNTVTPSSPDASVSRFKTPFLMGNGDDSSLTAVGFEGIAFERDGVENSWFKAIVSSLAVAGTRSNCCTIPLFLHLSFEEGVFLIVRNGLGRAYQ